MQNANVIDCYLTAIEKLCNGKCHSDHSQLKSELIRHVLMYFVGGKYFDNRSLIKSAISTSAKAVYYLNYRNSNFSFWRTKKAIKNSPHLSEEDKIQYENALDSVKRYFLEFIYES